MIDYMLSTVDHLSVCRIATSGDPLGQIIMWDKGQDSRNNWRNNTTCFTKYSTPTNFNVLNLYRAIAYILKQINLKLILALFPLSYYTNGFSNFQRLYKKTPFSCFVCATTAVNKIIYQRLQFSLSLLAIDV
jgi:hypothetical protein